MTGLYALEVRFVRMGSVPQWDEASARGFYLEQLKLVRAEADKLGDETRVTERFALGACGAIYTFILVQWEYLKSYPYELVLIIPVLLAVWGGLRSKALYIRIRQCAEFVKNAEDALPVEGWTGWEHWLTDPKRDEHAVANSGKAVWWTLIAGTALIAVAAVIARFV